MRKNRGSMVITFLVVLFIMVVVAVIVTVGVGKLRNRAEDIRIVSGVVQFGLLAKTHSEAQNGSYRNFDRCLLGDSTKCAGKIGSAVEALVADVEDAYEQADLVVKVSDDGLDYCVGATLIDGDGTIGRCVDSDEANTADQNLSCSNSAKCEVPGSVIPVEGPG